MVTFRDFLTEEVISLDELEALIELHDIAGISAFRDTDDCSTGNVFTKPENIARSKKMKGALKSKGYKLIDAQGQWTGGKEKSFILIDTKDTGTLKKYIIKLSEEFDQDAVLIKLQGKNAELISTNTCPDAFPGFGKKGVVEKLGKYKRGKAEFYTTVGKDSFHFT